LHFARIPQVRFIDYLNADRVDAVDCILRLQPVGNMQQRKEKYSGVPVHGCFKNKADRQKGPDECIHTRTGCVWDMNGKGYTFGTSYPQLLRISGGHTLFLIPEPCAEVVMQSAQQNGCAVVSR
jgi:hypothetical protein